MKKLHALWGNVVEFATVLVRQGHPGPAAERYRTFPHKAADAAAHEREDGVPWTVLVDDVDGRVHRMYGMLSDPTFLIDDDGRVAFYNAVTHAPTLHRAIDALMNRRGRGVVLGGYDRRPHLLAAIAGGWPALRRGLPRSVIDLETSLPGGAVLPFIGYQLRGVLRPIVLRGQPLPARGRTALAAAGVALAAAVLTFGDRRRRGGRLALAPRLHRLE
jgi:hypothetical protein